MESKAADGPRTSVSKLKEGSWWRWSHGKSGSTASSSHLGSLYDSSTQLNSNSHHKPAATAAPSKGRRWQKRSTRTSQTDSGSAAPSVVWSTSLDPWITSSSPHFFPTSSAVRSSRTSVGSLKKKAASSSPPSSTFMFWTRDDNRSASLDMPKSMEKRKRPGTSKDPRRATSASSSTRATRVVATRTSQLLPNVNEDTEMRAPEANSNVFAFATPQKKPSRGSSPSLKSVKPAKSFLAGTSVAACQDEFAKATKVPFPPSSPSAASTASTTSSFSSLSFSTVDPLVNCARAVLQDCIRNRQMEQSSARKRAIEEDEFAENKAFGWHGDAVSKRNMSPGSSSSSDDELSQLSSMDQSFCAEKVDRSYSSKVAREEMYRQILVGDCDLSSSPEFQCLSPMVEEKGLPIEVRYQLPLALGTANEISKECTICQLHYGIGDHIVTLPCQHFFHACCVDKWLWNHTSCPLCRTEVILDLETEVQCTKHNFTECSPVDQERIRRQMRSSSQHVGFRPVVPVEIDRLELEVACMAIDEDSDVEDEPSYLICPTPHLATNALDDYPNHR